MAKRYEERSPGGVSEDVRHGRSILRTPSDDKMARWLHLPPVWHDKAWYIWEKELFERLIRACVSTLTITYQELVAGKAL
jgi:hypothetical protein